MAVNNYSYEIDSVIVCKFGSLIAGIPHTADKINSIDLTAQVLEFNMYESLFDPAIHCELAVHDHIGLMVNFPLSGEEAVIIRYRNIRDNRLSTLYFIIDSITDMALDDAARASAYIIKCVSLESYANSKQTVQQGYKDTMPNVAKLVFDEHIVGRLQKVMPSYIPPTLFVETTDNLVGTVVIPNIHPFAAIKMLADMSVEESGVKSTYLFYQTSASYNFCTLQGLFAFSARGRDRARAQERKYLYISNQSSDPTLLQQNEGRIVSNMIVNKRLSSIEKLSMGYFHNNHFEINIAQKSVWGQPTFTDDANTIYSNKLNTSVYSALAPVEGDDEQSNRTRYTVTTQKEYDGEYPISRFRDKWGKDLIAHAAMSQIDLTVTIPGTSEFHAGDLFYLEIPEMHGFNEVKMDDLISGLFVITEVKQMLHVGGFHTTVLRINRDSYMSSIDRGSKYAG